MRLTVDSPVPVLQLLREVKLTVDPRYRGELRRFTENAGLRCNYFARHGKTIDECGEALWTAGYVDVRPTEREVLDLLETLFSAVDRAPSTRTTESEANADGRAFEAELERARKNRYRTWVCPCGDSLIRSARLTLRLRCEGCDARLVRTERTVAEIKMGVSLETIQSPDYKPAADSEAAPF